MPLPTISVPPHSISPAEHDHLTSSTPASFADIPPVLRWEDDAEIVLAAPCVDGWTVGERVRGRLYVTEDAVSFLPTDKPGFTLPFPQLTLHALTPAGELPAHLYCQVDEGGPANGAAADANGADEDEYAPLSEMRIFVEGDKLEPLFTALSQCSALHDSLLPSGEPSSFFGFGDDDDDDEWDDDGAFDDADDDEQGAGRSTRARDAVDARVKVEREINDDQNDADADEDEDEIDPISAFLAKVDWGNIPPPSDWTDVTPDPDMDARINAASAAVDPHTAEAVAGAVRRGECVECAAKDVRIARLEKELALARGEAGGDVETVAAKLERL